MDKLIRTLRVKDGNADQLTLYEFDVRTSGAFGTRHSKRWELDSGERVERVDEYMFKIVDTGEILSVLKDD